MTTTERNIHLGVLGAALAVSVWVFGAQPRSGEPATHDRADARATTERSPLSIIPQGSAFMLSVDVRKLAHAPLGTFIAERLGRSAGTSKLAQTCGFDPLLALDQLALAIPSADLAASAHPDFGIVANGRFSAAEITRCASTAISARGSEAIRTKLGSFDTVRDRNASNGEIAAKDGLVIVSGGSYFRDLLDSAERAPRAPGRDDARSLKHGELRRALGPGAVVVSWLLGEGWFERVAGGETNARLSPLSALKSVGARMNVDKTAELQLLLECADKDGASRISSLLGELQSALDTLPLDPALKTIAKRLTVEQTEARLRLDLALTQAELIPLLDLLGAQTTGVEP
ncbi:MAG TPA: hypothetical protein VER11_13125 [Polyangiaceae bacterium]|nr:hypothetical protein [Polyangiaceae bacterium]